IFGRYRSLWPLAGHQCQKPELVLVWGFVKKRDDCFFFYVGFIAAVESMNQCCKFFHVADSCVRVCGSSSSPYWVLTSSASMPISLRYLAKMAVCPWVT